jgi:hypothetical protein
MKSSHKFVQPSVQPAVQPSSESSKYFDTDSNTKSYRDAVKTKPAVNTDTQVRSGSGAGYAVRTSTTAMEDYY